MNMPKKSIGILGGMGPLATADLFRKIVTLTDAARDNDHIRIYIDDNATIPDRTAAILEGGPSPLPAMTDSLRKLESCGADCLVMPCNTAHYFLPQLQSLTKVPFLSMLQATAAACRDQFPDAVAGVLATRGTLKAGLYQQALEDAGVPFLIPEEEEQDALMRVIYDGYECRGGGAGPPGRRVFHPGLHGASAGGGADGSHRSHGGPHRGAGKSCHSLLRVLGSGISKNHCL